MVSPMLIIGGLVCCCLVILAIVLGVYFSGVACPDFGSECVSSPAPAPATVPGSSTGTGTTPAPATVPESSTGTGTTPTTCPAKAAGTYYTSINGCATAACSTSAACPATTNGTSYLPAGSCLDATQSQPNGFSGAGSCLSSCNSGYVKSAPYSCVLAPPITCPSGQYLSGSTCTNCPANTYKAGTDAGGINRCVSVPANASVNATKDGWVCNSGYLEADVSGAYLINLPTGYAQATQCKLAPVSTPVTTWTVRDVDFTDDYYISTNSGVTIYRGTIQNAKDRAIALGNGVAGYWINTKSQTDTDPTTYRYGILLASAKTAPTTGSNGGLSWFKN